MLIFSTHIVNKIYNISKLAKPKTIVIRWLATLSRHFQCITDIIVIANPARISALLELDPVRKK